MTIKQLKPFTDVLCINNMEHPVEFIDNIARHTLSFTKGNKYLVLNRNIIQDEYGIGHVFEEELFEKYFREL